MGLDLVFFSAPFLKTNLASIRPLLFMALNITSICPAYKLYLVFCLRVWQKGLNYTGSTLHTTTQTTVFLEQASSVKNLGKQISPF